MKRKTYKGYIIDNDNMGRPYIYNTKSPYAEESDRIYLIAPDYIQNINKPMTTLQAAKKRIDCLIELDEIEKARTFEEG